MTKSSLSKKQNWNSLSKYSVNLKAKEKKVRPYSS